jgi:hypothetical protein
MSKRNTEFRTIPGVRKEVKVSRDGEIKYEGEVVTSGNVTIRDKNGKAMSIQMTIHKAFPDIPMRHTPTR